MFRISLDIDRNNLFRHRRVWDEEEVEEDQGNSAAFQVSAPFSVESSLGNDKRLSVSANNLIEVSYLRKRGKTMVINYSN